MKKYMLRISAWQFALLLFANPVFTDDSVRGYVLASPCMSCHGPNGKSPGYIPSIQGQEAGYIKEKLIGFKNGTEEATVMDRLSKGYSDTEIDMIAEYFASMKSTR